MIGIDIQPQSIHLVQIKRKKQKFIIDWAKTSPLPLLPENSDHWQQIESVLKQLIPIGKYAASLALSANLIRMQTITLPIGLNDPEIKKEIETYIERDSPESKDALCIDFNHKPSVKTGYIDIFFAAVKEKVLTQYTACLKRAGFNLHLIDVDLLAINRIALLLLPHLSQKKYLVFYCTNERAILFAVHNQHLVFYQILSLTKQTEYNEFYNQLNNHIQFYINNYPKTHTKNLVICSSNLYSKKASQELIAKYDFDFYYLYLSSALFLNIDSISTDESTSLDFLLALSVAIQGEKYD
jgi:Tfp pilus assembly PilM family ATPase